MNRSTKGNKVLRSQIVTLKDVDHSRSQIATLNNNASDVDALVLSKIYVFREQQVMLDKDLALLYGVDVKRLNEQVKRNRARFPSDFMFQLSIDECSRSQIATLNMARGRHLKYYPYVFTENGIAMLSSVLKSERAVETNIQIMRTFTQMRKLLATSAGVLQRLGAIEIKQLETDKRLDTVFDALDRGNLLPNGLLLPESEFDSLRMVTRLVEGAAKEIVIIDPYSDVSTLEVLAHKKKGVSVRLVCKDRGKPTATEIAKFNKQYGGLTIVHSDRFHDRFVIIDNTELHNLGSSINHLGRRLTTYSTRDPKEIAKIERILKP